MRNESKKIFVYKPITPSYRLIGSVKALTHRKLRRTPHFLRHIWKVHIQYFPMFDVINILHIRYSLGFIEKYSFSRHRILIHCLNEADGKQALSFPRMMDDGILKFIRHNIKALSTFIWDQFYHTTSCHQKHFTHMRFDMACLK